MNIQLSRPYIRPYVNGRHPIEPLMKKIFSGKIKNEWILSQNANHIVWRNLVKEIRANLFLAYIRNRFGNPIVFIIRHPCAIVFSRIQLKWGTLIDDLFSQDELMEDFLAPFESFIRDAKTDLEKHTIMWCVENLVPLKQLKKDEFLLCSYENLVVQQELEIKRIFRYLDLKIPAKLSNVISKPTTVTQKNAPIYQGGNLLESWKKNLDSRDVRKVLEITERFNIDIYSENTMPDFDCSFLQ